MTVVDAATFSGCGTYRYHLSRDLSSLLNRGSVLFVMLNPSTADAAHNDPTVTRCIGYAESWGYGRLDVANLYAYRATDPAELVTPADPVGPENDAWIARLADDADRVIVAWGADVGPLADRAERVLAMVGEEVYALGLTASGQPRHPLYVKAKGRDGQPLEPIPYPPEDAVR